MKERPILFNTEMVKAVLEGRKTQTRRVIKQIFPREMHPVMEGVEMGTEDGVLGVHVYIQTAVDDNARYFYKCPYGKAGDRLWVRETHYRYGKWVKNGKTKTGRQAWKFLNTVENISLRKIFYIDNPPPITQTKKTETGWFKRPSIFMPRWASRINLEIINIRVERVQDISLQDKWNEGYPPERGKFSQLWDSINKKRGYGWEVNPWVWVVEFKRVNDGT